MVINIETIRYAKIHVNVSRNTSKRSALCRVYKNRLSKMMIMRKRYHGSGKQGRNNGAGQGVTGNTVNCWQWFKI